VSPEEDVMTLQTFLDAFDNVRSAGVNRWTARCPVPDHNDRTPSLSIALGEDDRRLVHCFGGCGLHAILAAANLTLADLFPNSPAGGQPPRTVASYPEQVQAHILALERRTARRWAPLRASLEEAELIRLERQLADRCRRLAARFTDDADLGWELRRLAADLDTAADESEARLDADLREQRGRKEARDE
jgi:hypothetical protein